MTLEEKARKWHQANYIFMVTPKHEAKALAETEKQIDMLVKFARFMGLKDDEPTPDVPK